MLNKSVRAIPLHLRIGLRYARGLARPWGGFFHVKFDGHAGDALDLRRGRFGIDAPDGRLYSKGAGYTVIDTADGQACGTASAIQTGLVLTDQIKPGSDGITLVKTPALPSFVDRDADHQVERQDACEGPRSGRNMRLARGRSIHVVTIDAARPSTGVVHASIC